MKITFHGDLIELIRPDHHQGSLEMTLKEKRSANDLIQSFGIPHTEVGFIRVNETEKTTLSFALQTGDTLDVFPTTPPQHLPNSPPPRLLLDVHLWKLARRLRLLGIDIAFNPQWEDPQLAEISFHQNRTLLTRDRGLLMRSIVNSGLLVRHTHTESQVIEILQRLNLKSFINPFTRCIMCNDILQRVDMESHFFKQQLSPIIPDRVAQWCSEYRYCRSCKKMYWKGSHYKKLITDVKYYLDNV
jgi:uncharacterized protein with PIN domain